MTMLRSRKNSRGISTFAETGSGPVGVREVGSCLCFKSGGFNLPAFGFVDKVDPETLNDLGIDAAQLEHLGSCVGKRQRYFPVGWDISTFGPSQDLL